MERTNTVSLFETISTLLEKKRYATLRDILTTLNPVDIAAVFEDLQSEKSAILFRLLPKETAADTFVEMDEETQELLIHGFSDTELKTSYTLISLKDGAAGISASSQRPAPENGILSASSLDRQKKEAGTRFTLTFQSYQGTADVSYNAYFTFDTDKGQTREARECYYITGILRPIGQPITVSDAKDKYMYITVAITITHKIIHQGD